MATLNIWNHLSFVQGFNEITLKHGSRSDPAVTPKAITVAGDAYHRPGSLADQAYLELWDRTEDTPADWLYFMIVSDQDLQVQFITASTQVVIPLIAGVPLNFAADSIFAAASTTPLTGGNPATPAQIVAIGILNDSGETATFDALFLN